MLKRNKTIFLDRTSFVFKILKIKRNRKTNITFEKIKLAVRKTREN